jgi:hypothetical protein
MRLLVFLSKRPEITAPDVTTIDAFCALRTHLAEAQARLAVLEKCIQERDPLRL